MRKLAFILALAVLPAFLCTPAVAREDTVIPVVGKPVNGRPFVNLIDEDDMTSNSPYAVPTQQSVRAYVTRFPKTDVAMDGVNVYTIDKANGSEFWINDFNGDDVTRDAGSGVSVLLPKITEAYDGYVARVYKAPDPFSGTTDICVSTVPWVSGTTDHIWNVTSGVTYESAAHVMPEIVEIDAVGDWLEFKAVYGATGSTWFQTGRYIQ